MRLSKNTFGPVTDFFILPSFEMSGRKGWCEREIEISFNLLLQLRSSYQDFSVGKSPAFYEFAFILNSHRNVRRKLSLFISSMIHSLIGRFSINIKLMPGLLPS